MATFILVHGGGHGGWCYNKVSPLLRAEGHLVLSPSLTGCGDRKHVANGTAVYQVPAFATGALGVLTNNWQVAGILALIIQLAVSIRDREKSRDLTGDPWDARSLEWSTASPAPFYNFAHIPLITSLEQHWENKETGRSGQEPRWRRRGEASGPPPRPRRSR